MYIQDTQEAKSIEQTEGDRKRHVQFELTATRVRNKILKEKKDLKKHKSQNTNWGKLFQEINEIKEKTGKIYESWKHEWEWSVSRIWDITWW